MSAEADRNAALEVHHRAGWLNDAIAKAREIGLTVDITVDMVKLATLPTSTPRITARVLKPIEPGEKQ